MQHQTVPQTYRAIFDDMAGVEPVIVPAPATVAEIAAKVREAFDEAVEIDVKVQVDMSTGGVTVANEDGDIFERGRIEGPGIPEEPKPDYWLTLADELRQAADRIACLAGTAGRVDHPRISLAVSLNRDESSETMPVVEAIARVFDATAKTEQFSGSTWHHSFDKPMGGVRVWAYAVLDEPEDTEKAALRAELEQLRAQLAQGGAR